MSVGAACEGGLAVWTLAKEHVEALARGRQRAQPVKEARPVEELAAVRIVAGLVWNGLVQMIRVADGAFYGLLLGLQC